MSRRNKLKKFADILEFPNVYENFDFHRPALTGVGNIDFAAKGNWHKEHFKNDNPITLELACGRGEYTLGLAQMYPDRNFIGVDIKGARIWQGATIAIEKNITNVAFVRTQIEQIAEFFDKGEVAEIWITFPDPFLKDSKSNRRLTSPQLLPEYKKILPSNGIVNLKTDSPELYEFTLETLAEQTDYTLLYNDDDIYAKKLPMKELELKTYYEGLHLKRGRTIKYVKIRVDG
ncbi:MAG: tRNA (guanine-N7-)-methyltransferase [Paraglaciecola sp.]|jgi:tRNA (guanine-N7-)-methyltransferase